MLSHADISSTRGQAEHKARAVACIGIPTYNEAENVSALLPQMSSRCTATATHEVHVLVVGNSSPGDCCASTGPLLAANLPISSGQRTPHDQPAILTHNQNANSCEKKELLVWPAETAIE